MFSSQEGRWLSPDPRHGNISNPQSLNRYAYVNSNPCTLADPLGLDGEGPPEPPNPFLYNGEPASSSAVDDEQRIQRHLKIDPCDEDVPTNKRILDFIRANLAAAEKLATELGLQGSVQDILGLSGEESTYGTSPIAVNAHNFFGLHAGAPGSTGTYTTSRGVTVSAFPATTGFASSGQAFVDLYGGAVTGVADPTKFAQALVKAGFNTGKAGTGNPDFVSLVSGSIAAIGNRLDCPQLHH
jgi:flagellum-specific peptidoglycan hydrolase FlgJ